MESPRLRAEETRAPTDRDGVVAVSKIVRPYLDFRAIVVDDGPRVTRRSGSVALHRQSMIAEMRHPRRVALDPLPTLHHEHGRARAGKNPRGYATTRAASDHHDVVPIRNAT
jgi:hypothetical protein